MYTFYELQSEIKRRALRDQSGTAYDTAIKNAINASLFRIAREACWRRLRRKAEFNTITSYTGGSGAASATTSSTAVTITGATLLTSVLALGRYIKLSGDGDYYQVKEITGNTALTLNREWAATSATNMTYEIYPQAIYNLPIQSNHRMFMWHEDYGYPFLMEYMPHREFIENGYDHWEKGTPETYTMWNENMVINQPRTAGKLTVFSTSSADVSIGVTIFGTVGGYPAYETITTNASDGTTITTGTLSFTEVERISKNSTSAGRINVCADTQTSTTVAVVPMGDFTGGIDYSKVQFYPTPERVYPIYVQYYKEPYALVGDNDIHELGQEFDEAIILLSVSKIKAESDQKEAGSFYQLFIDELRSLRKTNSDKFDWFPKMQRPGSNNKNWAVRPGLLYRQFGSQFGPSSRW